MKNELKLKTTLIVLMMLVVHAGLFAQQKGMVEMTIQSDQHVYIVGEKIWVSGDISDKKISSKFMSVQLLDRNGVEKAKVKLVIDQNLFSGYINIPQDLRSDFYFLNCFIKGVESHVKLQSLAIIHPQYPPLPCVSADSTMATDLQVKQYLNVSSDKLNYTTRSFIEISLGDVTRFSNLSVDVVRDDLFSKYADSVIRLKKVILHHAAKGDLDDEGHEVTLKVLLASTGDAQKNVLVNAYIIGDRAKISTGISNEFGEVKFIFPVVYDDSKIVFSVADQQEKLYKLEMEEEFESTAAIAFPCMQLNESMRSDLEARMLAKNITQGFYTDSTSLYSPADLDTTDFYGNPDARYMLDEYVRFPDMKEILLEFVPEVRVKNPEGENPSIQVLNDPYKTYFTQNTLVLLDGVAIKNVKDLFAMDPLLLRSIDVVSRKYFLGVLQFNGIVHYKSYKKDLAGFALTPNEVIYPFTGVQKISRPLFNEYTIKSNQRFPDFRNLLFRDLNLMAAKNTNSKFGFYSTDATGNFKVVVRGVEKSGEVIYGEKIISVK
jgi:hypothetical protein